MINTVIEFLYSPLMIFFWIIAGVCCLVIAPRSGCVLLPTRRERQIKVIYYYICALFLLVTAGIFFILFSFCLEFIKANYPLTRLVRFIWQITLCLIPWIYCVLSVRVNKILSRQVSLTEKNDSENYDSRSLDRYVTYAFRSAMAAALFAFVPVSVYCFFFYPGQALLVPYVFPFLLVVSVGGLSWFHYRQTLPLLRGDLLSFELNSDRQDKRNWGVFFGDIALIVLILLFTGHFLFFNTSYHLLESKTFTAASVLFCCALFLAIGLWSGVPVKRYRVFIAVGILTILLDTLYLGALKSSPLPELRAVDFSLFPSKAILFSPYLSLIVSGIAGIIAKAR